MSKESQNRDTPTSNSDEPMFPDLHDLTIESMIVLINLELTKIDDISLNLYLCQQHTNELEQAFTHIMNADATQTLHKIFISDSKFNEYTNYVKSILRSESSEPYTDALTSEAESLNTLQRYNAYEMTCYLSSNPMNKYSLLHPYSGCSICKQNSFTKTPKETHHVILCLKLKEPKTPVFPESPAKMTYIKLTYHENFVPLTDKAKTHLSLFAPGTSLKREKRPSEPSSK
jgi:hypothetical protein